jgi:four helix bundle protein
MLTLDIYRVTSSFPRQELFGLVSQLRRASSSIAANLAEGSGRHTEREFARFVSLAAGSAWEVDYHLLLARDLDYVAPSTYAALNEQVIGLKKMLAKLHARIDAAAQGTWTE